MPLTRPLKPIPVPARLTHTTLFYPTPPSPTPRPPPHPAPPRPTPPHPTSPQGGMVVAGSMFSDHLPDRQLANLGRVRWRYV
jgi:hypothetical protein